MLPAGIAEFPNLRSVRMLLAVLGRCVVAVLALTALQRDDFSHLPIPLLGDLGDGAGLS
jgi:hypothetical protein